MQAASFDYTIRDVEGTILGTATWVDEALAGGAAEHERTGEVVTVHAPDGSEVAWFGDRAVVPVPEEAEGTTETPVAASRSISAFAALHEIAWHRDPAAKWHYDYGLALSAAQRENDDNLSTVQVALMQSLADPTLAEHLNRALEDRRKLDRAEAAWRSMSQALADLCMYGRATMDETTYAKVVEALTQVGADEVLSSTRWTARFGSREVEVIISDAGPVFAKRYAARAMDQAGFVSLSGPCHTLPGCVGALDWEALLTY